MDDPEPDKPAPDAPRADVSLDAGGGDAEQPPSSSRASLPDETLQDERSRTPPRLLFKYWDNHRAMRPATGEPLPETGSDGTETNGDDESVTNAALEQAATYRRDHDERSPERSGAGTLTISGAPEPMDYGNLSMEQLANHLNERTARQTSNAVAVTPAEQLATEIASADRTMTSTPGRMAEGERTLVSQGMQATLSPSSEPCESTGAQDRAADAGHQPVQSGNDDEAGENSTKLLEQTVLPRREDGVESAGGSLIKGVIPEAARRILAELSTELSTIPKYRDQNGGIVEGHLRIPALSEASENVGSWQIAVEEQDTDVPSQTDDGPPPAFGGDEDHGPDEDKSAALGHHPVGEATETTTMPTAHPPHDSQEPEADDDSDSEAESVLSQASLASTATSLGGVLAASTGNLITKLTSDLLCTDEINTINITALKDPGIGSERYRRNVRRLIKAFGQDLRAEAKGSMQLAAARALQTRRISTHAARELMTRSEVLLGEQDDVADTNSGKPADQRDRRQHQEGDEDDAMSDASVDSADEEEDAEQPIDESFARVRDFLVTSKAYAALKDRMLRFAHQPYHLRISKAIGDAAISESGKTLHPEDLAIIVEEVSWVPIHLFTSWIQFGSRSVTI